MKLIFGQEWQVLVIKVKHADDDEPVLTFNSKRTLIPWENFSEGWMNLVNFNHTLSSGSFLTKSIVDEICGWGLCMD